MCTTSGSTDKHIHTPFCHPARRCPRPRFDAWVLRDLSEQLPVHTQVVATLQLSVRALCCEGVCMRFVMWMPICTRACT